MKKLSLFISVMVVLLGACTKDDVFNSDQGMGDPFNASLKSAKVVIEVYPGGDDTQSLLDAFAQAAEYGKGAVIRLMPGTFTIGMIEVRDFYGTLAGSGKGTTVITNLPGLSPAEVLAKHMIPALIAFTGGDVTITDLSVRASEGYSPGMRMLLFSDYSAGYMPEFPYIKVTLDKIEVTGLLREDVPITDQNGNVLDVIDYPYPSAGAHFRMNHLLNTGGVFLRSNIDASVSNCEFSNFMYGIHVWGCKSGNFRFGMEGGNKFSTNVTGIAVNENLGLNVKIRNNEFITPGWYYDGIDLNTGEAAIGGYNPLEVPDIEPGTYEVKNNKFIVYGPDAHALGIMDSWRLAHPEYNYWMKMIIDDNTFELKERAVFYWTYCAKEMHFANNNIIGDETMAWAINTIFWWTNTMPNNTSEDCQFINNHFAKNTNFILDFNVNNYLIVGDLSYLNIIDFGEGTQVNEKTNPNHANGTNETEMMQLKKNAESRLKERAGIY